jgi:hypothetical protein
MRPDPCRPVAADEAARLPMDKSLTASDLQKSIRFGLQQHAADQAARVVDAHPWWGWYRIAVCACEDTSDPALIAEAIQRSFTEWKSEARCNAAAKLACRLAGSIKSRVCAELWLIEGGDQPIPDGLSKIERLASDLSMKMRRGFGGAVGRSFVLTRAATEIVTTTPNTAMIGDHLEAAHDWHVGTGKRSLAYLAKASTLIRRFFETHPNARRIDALGEALFSVEGGVLDRRWTSPAIEALTQRCAKHYAETYLAMSGDEFQALTEIVRQELPTLRRARVRILAAQPAQGSLGLPPPSTQGNGT